MKHNFFSAALLSIPFVAGTAIGQQDERPNIVVVIADDLGTNELSCYGGQNLQTTNIDRLAKEGILLTNNYASTAMSVPVRASMYTGLYPARHGSYQNHKKTNTDVKSITHYMPLAGYKIARTGKDHPGGQPQVYNFEKIPGFTVGCTALKAPYTTDGIEKFMSNSKDPFCLFVCSIHPHAPWSWGNPGEFDPDKVVLPPNCVDNKQIRELFCHYLAEIRALDNEVGSVYAALEKVGKLDNTLFIFLGEQGPRLPFGKWTAYRYGQHSAFIARYPQKIKAGTTSDAIVQYEDIMPTLLEFAGGEKIKDIDGISCLPVLFGKKKEHRQWAYGIHNNIPEGRAYPIRSIQDKRYKLIMNLKSEVDYHEKHLMDPNAKEKVWDSFLQAAETDEFAQFLVNHYTKRPAVEFYDLKKDPWELNNLAGEKKYFKRIQNMKAELFKWMEQQGDTGADMDIPQK